MDMIDSVKNYEIFIIHALQGYEVHEKRIRNLFKKSELHFEFVTDGDPSRITDEVLEKYFVADIDKRLSKGVLSCTLNHIFAYEKIVQRGIKCAIVFENDPFFLGNFIAKLNKLADEIKKLPAGHIISLENSTLRFPSYWQVKSGKFLYQAEAGRMAGAYIIDIEGATKILSDLKTSKCHTVIDWWHNSLIEREIVKMYWAHPPLVEQGSHNGLLCGTISTKPKSLKRRIKWLIQRTYRYYVGRFISDRRISE